MGPKIGVSYVLSVYSGDARHTVLVWNGLKNYERLPSPENINQINMGGLVFGKKVSIVQIGKPVGRGMSSLQCLAVHLRSGCDSLSLLARDTKTYESIRDELRIHATVRIDGTPMCAD